jgi:hypothetical protein
MLNSKQILLDKMMITKYWFRNLIKYLIEFYWSKENQSKLIGLNSQRR